MEETTLQIANRAFRNGDYLQAIHAYVCVIRHNPAMAKNIAVNISLARRKLRLVRANLGQPKVAFFCGDSDNTTSPSGHNFLKCYEDIAAVERINLSCLLTELTPAIKDPFDNKADKLGLKRTKGFVDNALDYVITNHYDAVYFTKESVKNSIIGIIYQLVWGAYVVASSENEHQVISNANESSKLSSLPEIDNRFLEFNDLEHGLISASLSKYLLEIFDKASKVSVAEGKALYFYGSGGWVGITNTKEFFDYIAGPQIHLHSQIAKVIPHIGNQALDGLQLAADLSWLSSQSSRDDGETSAPKIVTYDRGNNCIPCVLFKNDCKELQSKNSWTSQQELNGLADERQILLGCMCLGRLQASTEQQQLPKPVVDSIEAFSRIVDIPKFHRLRVKKAGSLESINGIGGDHLQCRVHCFDSADLDFSLWYANDRDLRMQIVIGGDGEFKSFVFRGYQYDPKADGGLVLVCEHAIDSNLAFLDLALINPYLPILLTLSNPDATLVDATLIPYPSLLPGGLHETEFLAAEGQTIGALASALMSEHLQASNASVGWGLAKLLVDTTEAIGSERIFSRDFKEWLWSVFSLRLNPCIMSEVDSPLSDYWREVFQLDALPSAEKLAIHGKRYRQGSTLVCPPDAIPSLRLLTASLADGGLGRVCTLRTYLFDRPGFPKHRYRVTMPAGFATSSKDSFALDGAIRRPFIIDSQKSGLSDFRSVSNGAIAISMPRLGEYSKVEDLRLLMPVAPEIGFALGRDKTPAFQPKIFVVITGAEFTRETFALCLESLHLQRQVELCSIILAPSQNADCAMLSELLKCHFPQRHEVLPVSSGTYAQSVQQAAAKCPAKDEAASILFINKPLLLHDARTLSTLAALLARSKVATSSCMLIARGQQPKAPTAYDIASSGNFSAGSAANGEMRFGDCDARSLLSDSVYPVAWNNPALLMVQAHRWAKNRGFANGLCHDHSAFIEYSAKQSLLGDIHLCTSRISVELLSDLTPSDLDTTNISQEAIAALAAGGMQIEVLPS